MSAALERDAPKATDLIEVHIRRTTENVRQWFKVQRQLTEARVAQESVVLSPA
jgi:hypothetical protein